MVAPNSRDNRLPALKRVAETATLASFVSEAPQTTGSFVSCFLGQAETNQERLNEGRERMTDAHTKLQRACSSTAQTTHGILRRWTEVCMCIGLCTNRYRGRSYVYAGALLRTLRAGTLDVCGVPARKLPKKARRTRVVMYFLLQTQGRDLLGAGETELGLVSSAKPRMEREPQYHHLPLVLFPLHSLLSSYLHGPACSHIGDVIVIGRPTCSFLADHLSYFSMYPLSMFVPRRL